MPPVMPPKSAFSMRSSLMPVGGSQRSEVVDDNREHQNDDDAPQDDAAAIGQHGVAQQLNRDIEQENHQADWRIKQLIQQSRGAGDASRGDIQRL